MNHLEVKSYSAEFKATKDGAKGIVTALVSVFNNIDLGGDRMLPGSFTKTIQDWQAKGDPLPVIWSHEWDNPSAHIGFVNPADMKETDQGLEVKMQFDLDRPFAEQVFHLQKTRRVTQFSFGYYVTDSEVVKEGPDTIRNIKAVDLFEVGPTLLGMNPATQLLEAASALNGAKAGRVLNASNEEALKGARDLIDGVLKSVPQADDRTSSVTGKSAEDIEKKDGMEEGNDLYPTTPRQTFMQDATENVVEVFGKFDQSAGPEGAHYAPADANPFKAEGLMCQNCVFFQGPRGCEVVAGDIDPEAVCKLWVIPGNLLPGAAAADMPADGTKSESADTTRDSGSTINQEHVIALLSKPRHTED